MDNKLGIMTAIFLILTILCGTGIAQDRLPYICSFETTDLCGMTQRTDDDFNWERISGTTPTAGTGPSNAIDGSWYVYIEGSSPRRENNRAVLETPALSYTGTVCIHFQYNMHGDGIGSVQVDVGGRRILEVSGDEGNSWKVFEKSEQINSNDVVSFTAIRGKSYRSDIGLDDIIIRQGLCSGDETTVIPTTAKAVDSTVTPTTVKAVDSTVTPTTVEAVDSTVTPTTVEAVDSTVTPTTVKAVQATVTPTTVKGVDSTVKPTTVNGGDTTVTPTSDNVVQDDFGCNFESQSNRNADCYIRQDTNDDFNWIRGQLKTPSGARFNRRMDGQLFPVTGPLQAFQGNYYVYIETSNIAGSRKGSIFIDGRSVRSGGDKCLKFCYEMNGYHIGSLQVFADMGSERKTYWEMKGDHGPNWMKAAIDINTNNLNQLGIEAVTSVSGEFSGDIAIDDVQILSGKCQSTPSTASDFLFVCTMETQEDASTWCGMSQDSRDNFDWSIFSGNTPSQLTGPSSAESQTYYMYIEATGKQDGNEANILLPRLNHNGAICVEFYSHMYGFHIGSLSIFIRRNNADIEQWNLSGAQGNRWIQQRVTINDLKSSDEVGFKGKTGAEYSGDIALDSVRIRRNSC